MLLMQTFFFIYSKGKTVLKIVLKVKCLSSVLGNVRPDASKISEIT